MRIVLSIIVTICCMSGELPAYADRYPAGLSNHRFNGSNKPATVAGITTFHINDRQCSDVDYGDGRGENDCYNGNIRSVLSHQPQAVLNENWEYRFDIWVDPSFSYPGFYNDHARDFMPGSFDSRLRIASWEGPFIHNFLYAVKVDAKNGISFLGKECQSKSSFGEWVAFSMKIGWANNERGWTVVTCNNKKIYENPSVATNQAPHCYITNQCEPGVPKDPKRILFVLGPVMAGFGPGWKQYGKESQFTSIQPGGITVKVRNTYFG